jgi:hypothetical protein
MLVFHHHTWEDSMVTCQLAPQTLDAGNAGTFASMVYVTRDRSAFRTLSFWPTMTVNPIDGAEFHRSWLDCLMHAPNGEIDLHPDFAIAENELCDPPLVYTRRVGSKSEPPSFASLAVLGARNRHLPLLPGLPWRVSLRERYLLADQVAGDNSIEALSGFMEGVRQVLRTGVADWVYFDDVEVDSPLWKLLADSNHAPGVAVFYPSPPQARWRLRFPEKPEDVWTNFTNRTRENFRKRLKKFPHQLHCYRGESEVGTFLAKAHAVSLKSWQTQHMGLRISLDAEQQRRWERIARMGAMRSYILEHEGAPVAFMQSVQWKGTVLGIETGYDQAYAKFSPGTILLVRMLEDLLAKDTPRRLDFGWGDAEYKQMFSNERTVSGRVLLVRRAIKPLLVARLRDLGQTIARFVRAGVNRSNSLVCMIRKWKRRGVI